jgi:uncharacterized metal-binding protein YceD (DUF177 family)
MVSHADATLNLASLLKTSPARGGEDEVSGEGLLQPSAALLEHSGITLAGPLDWQLTVRRAGGENDFLLDGEVSGTVEVEADVAADLLYAMAYRASVKGLKLTEDAESGEILLFGQPEVDFAELLTEVLAVDLPLAVLCQEECRGLSEAGVNLNEHPEAAGDEARENEQESPFKSLKDIKLEG